MQNGTFQSLINSIYWNRDYAENNGDGNYGINQVHRNF